MRRLKSYRCLLALGILLCLSSFLSVSSVRADIYRIYRKSQWEEWTFPKGAVKLEADGRVSVVYIRARKDSLNACLNADKFTGGIKEARSNGGDAGKIIDGDSTTCWSPDPRDDLEDWWIEVDLGRAVAVTEVRLVFADKEGARPFRDFRVYKSDGTLIYPGSPIVEYTLIGKTTRPNTSSVVRYKLGFSKADTTSAGGEVTRALDFDQVQYVRVILDSKLDSKGSENPALAELEVYTLGDNIALGTDQRGGNLDAHCFETHGDHVYDGDLTTKWTFPILTDEIWNKGTSTNPDAGSYFEWDLGNLFWLNQIVVWCGGAGYALDCGTGYAEGYIIATSDGSSKTAEGKFDYELVADVYNRDMPYQYNFSHEFERRKVRYIFFRHAHGTGNWRSRGNNGAYLHEIQIFGEGYPPGVTLTSDFIDLGRAKNITSIEWDADIGTRLNIRSRSGDTVNTVKHFYKKNGQEVTEPEYWSLPPPLRGDITEERVPGSDWSSWSRVYDWSGQSFLSPSPRRYTLLEVTLVSDDPEICPTLKSLSINYTEPLIKSVVGEITPRSVSADLPQDFLYRIWPTYTRVNKGFDRVLIMVPSAVDTDSVSVKIGGTEVSGDSVRYLPEAEGDSLIVQLPWVVRRDSVEIQFNCKVLKNSMLFEAFVGNSTERGLWQRIDPVRKEATTVALPSLPASDDLIGNLSITPRVITPNGDGTNDEMTISFSVFKVDKPAKVTIYDLRGEMIKELESASGNSYVWDGRESSGKRVAPGIYVCQIHVDADAGDNTATRTVGVAY